MDMINSSVTTALNNALSGKISPTTVSKAQAAAAAVVVNGDHHLNELKQTATSHDEDCSALVG